MAVGRATKEETGGHGALLGAAGGSGTAGKGAGGRPRPGCVRAGRWAAGAPEEAPLPRRRSAGTAVAVGGGGAASPASLRFQRKEKASRRGWAGGVLRCRGGRWVCRRPRPYAALVGRGGPNEVRSCWGASPAAGGGGGGGFRPLLPFFLCVSVFGTRMPRFR